MPHTGLLDHEDLVAEAADLVQLIDGGSVNFRATKTFPDRASGALIGQTLTAPSTYERRKCAGS